MSLECRAREGQVSGGGGSCTGGVGLSTPPLPCLLAALILLFYLVFYGFLTALFTLTMWVMLQTVDQYTPKYQDRLSVPGKALMHVPLDTPPPAIAARTGARTQHMAFHRLPSGWLHPVPALCLGTGRPGNGFGGWGRAFQWSST